MQKYLFITTLALVCLSCGNSKSQTGNTTASNENESMDNRTNAKEIVNPTVLLGEQQRKTLESNPYGDWFNTNFANYNETRKW